MRPDGPRPNPVAARPDRSLPRRDALHGLRRGVLTTLIVAASGAGCLSAGCSTPGRADPSSDEGRIVLPPRGPGALEGSAILARIQGLGITQREEFLVHQFAAGNVPEFLRNFVTVQVTRLDALGQSHQVEFDVLPDYLALGSDQDFFRMPMSPNLGQKIADMLGCSLPTRRMVDDVWAAALVRLNPVTFHPAVYDILSPSLFYQHHQQIEQQRAGQPLGVIVAGIKKDVIVSSVLAGVSNRVVIYGWHYPSGNPIQPRYAGHIASYADYSHGVRLVRDVVRVDGADRPLAAVLADPVLHPLLGDEGAFTSSRYPALSAETLPLSDRFTLTSGFDLASWRPKFTQAQLVSFLPRAPGGGDGRVVVVQDPVGGTDTLRCGHRELTDQTAQADIYCEYRPELAASGFERVGIFARDRAAGAFDGTLSQTGACYAMAWDSHDGRLWCMRVQGANLVDLLPNPIHLPSTGWRRFRIEARGAELRFALDGVEILRTTDSVYSAGEFGIGYHEFFTNNAFMRGTRADNWHADTTDALHLSYGVDAAGAVTFRTERGVPGDIYFRPITLEPRSFPNGWFLGLDPTLDELGAQLSSGHPLFLGLFDDEGVAETSAPLLPGLTLYGVAIDVFSIVPPVAASQPVSFVVP